MSCAGVSLEENMMSLPAKPQALEAPPPGRRSVPASLVWVPGCAGLMMAGEVILTLAGYEKGKEGGSK